MLAVRAFSHGVALPPCEVWTLATASTTAPWGSSATPKFMARVFLKPRPASSLKNGLMERARAALMTGPKILGFRV